ncbi:MAG: tail fiber domain-containing protein, partial [Chitinophagaceae bacterium]
LVSGSNNLILGYQAQASTTSVSNQVTIGNSSNNAYRMFAASWTNASDSKYKHAIADIPSAVDFVNKLRPVEFVYNHANNEEKSYGFIAQEMKEAVASSNLPNSGLVQNMDADHLGIKTTELIPFLTKAIQEQQAQIDELKKMIGKRKFKKHKK